MDLRKFSVWWTPNLKMHVGGLLIVEGRVKQWLVPQLETIRKRSKPGDPTDEVHDERKKERKNLEGF